MEQFVYLTELIDLCEKSALVIFTIFYGSVLYSAGHGFKPPIWVTAVFLTTALLFVIMLALAEAIDYYMYTIT